MKINKVIIHVAATPVDMDYNLGRNRVIKE